MLFEYLGKSGFGGGIEIIGFKRTVFGEWF